MINTRTRHRVLLVGPWRSDRAGGGCCSAGPESIGGQESVSDPTIDHDRACAGAVLAALRRAMPAGEVDLVDPRNTGYLLPVVFTDARRRGDGLGAALRSAVRATTAWALVVDGRVISRGTALTAASALTQLNHALDPEG